MKIIIDKVSGQIYDAIMCLFLNFNGEANRNTGDNVVSSDKELDRIARRIIKGADDNIPDILSLFFANSGRYPCFLMSFFEALSGENYDSIYDFINSLSEKRNLLSASLLMHYDYRKLALSEYQKAVESGKVTEIVEGMNAADRVKYHLMAYFYDTDSVISELEKQLSFVADSIVETDRRFAEKIDGIYGEISDESLLEGLLVKSGNAYPENTETIRLSCSLVNTGLVKLIADENRVRCIIGSNYKQILDKYSESSSLTISWKSLCRVFTDQIRATIIEMLEKEELYTTEIAQRLDLSVPTAFYHLEILTREKVLNFRTQGRKVYYSINYDYVRALSGFAMKILQQSGGN